MRYCCIIRWVVTSTLKNLNGMSFSWPNFCPVSIPICVLFVTVYWLVILFPQFLMPCLVFYESPVLGHQDLYPSLLLKILLWLFEVAVVVPPVDVGDKVAEVVVRLILKALVPAFIVAEQIIFLKNAGLSLGNPIGPMLLLNHLSLSPMWLL
ncbi:hypothetical protein CDL12_05483 [Handroanthus impetiginosus]|uniref:Uncharacterized protein n=1 Tax=Handroanthus impetiginosus TaxID=429701 RepID=A0A2G9HWC4_9LAMI|nr:hypothetical protein CDL12_05483 [Handroanthus impetiginosus]